MPRIRIYYSKLEQLRFTGNLDIHKLWERMLRRAGLPVAYSQGFHPHPRMQQGLPLPLGLTSDAEIMDVWLEDARLIEDIAIILQMKAHPGIVIQRLEQVKESDPALQNRVTGAVYHILFFEPPATEILMEKVRDLLSQKQIVRQRRGKEYDLRPLIENLEITKSEQGNQLILQLRAIPGATGRPDEVVDALGFNPYDTLIIRKAIIINMSTVQG